MYCPSTWMGPGCLQSTEEAGGTSWIAGLCFQLWPPVIPVSHVPSVSPLSLCLWSMDVNISLSDWSVVRLLFLKYKNNFTILRSSENIQAQVTANYQSINQSINKIILKKTQMACLPQGYSQELVVAAVRVKVSKIFCYRVLKQVRSQTLLIWTAWTHIHQCCEISVAIFLLHSLAVNTSKILLIGMVYSSNYIAIFYFYDIYFWSYNYSQQFQWEIS